MSGLPVNIAPPSDDVISLTAVDLFFAIIFLFLGVYITYKHGKPGLLCWPNLIGSALASIIGDLYLLVTRDKPLLPTVVSSVTSCAVLASIPLAIIGAVYLSNVVLPTPPKAKQSLYILIALSLANTLGITLAFVPQQSLQEVGTTIMLITLFGVCGWMMPTYWKVQRYAKLQHANAAPAKYMFWAAVVATPMWMVRIGAALAYAFTASPALNPTTGVFAVKFVLVFWMWLGATTVLTAGGWLGMKRVFPVGTTVEYLGEQDERSWDRDRRRALNRARRMTRYGEEADSVEIPIMPQTVRPKESTTSSLRTPGQSLHASSSFRSHFSEPEPLHENMAGRGRTLDLRLTEPAALYASREVSVRVLFD